ncbi:MAG: tetratricopeptide repeat protein [Planctomycetales bacterium]
MREGARGFTLAVLCLVAQIVCAQEKPKEDPADLKQLQERIGKLEQELQGLRKLVDASAAKPQGNGLLLILENAALAPHQYGDSNGARYLVLKFTLANQTNQPVTATREQFELLVDGQAQKPENVPDRLNNQSFPWGLDYVHLQRVLPFKQLRVPAGGTQGGWLFFPQIPAGTNVPQLELKLKTEPQVALNLNKTAAQRLDLQTEMIGPRKSLALMRIGGELNSLGVGALNEEFERLGAAKVTRVVAAWDESATPVEPQIATWLRLSAEQEDRQQASQLPFPTIPATLRMLYLARLPSPQFQARSVSRPGTKVAEDRFQARVEDAVRLALEPVFARVPLDELIAELKTGHPLSRAAGLATAAGRLPAEELPLVIAATQDKDPLIQIAAVRGLQHFGEEPALARLLEIIKKGQEPLASAAVESLAGSRFAPMQDALLKLLANEPLQQREKMFKALAKNPRPNLAEPLYQFVSESPKGMQVEFLQGLEMVGHPKLTPLLARALKNENPAVATEALRILVDKNLPEADEIATKYTLERLQREAPTRVMFRLLARQKPAQAVPLLLTHLKSAKDPAGIVATVGKIADPSVAPKLVEDYGSLPTSVQGEILKLLRDWQAPQFRDLAHKGLESSDANLVQAAAQALVEGDGDRGLPWIGETLKQTRKPEIVQILCNVLANLASPEAREILNQVRGIGPEGHRQAAMNALAQIRARSPGIQYLFQAQEAQQKRNYKEAIEQYTQAIKMDPDLFEAYLGRADCLVRRNMLKESGPDFAKSLELEPYSSMALTGVCLALTVDGKLDEAIRKLDEGRKLFNGDANFFYNAACVYGRGVEYLEKTKDAPQREEKIKEYTKLALVDLKHAIELGFRDFKWMKDDPDLKAFQKNPEFEKLTQSPANPTPKTSAE